MRGIGGAGAHSNPDAIEHGNDDAVSDSGHGYFDTDAPNRYGHAHADTHFADRHFHAGGDIYADTSWEHSYVYAYGDGFTGGRNEHADIAGCIADRGHAFADCHASTS